MTCAAQQTGNAPARRLVVGPLDVLGRERVAMASKAQIIARRTHVKGDEVCLTGLLRSIGCLYIMARAADPMDLRPENSDTAGLIADWHPAAAKAALQYWQKSEAMSGAVHEQTTRGPPVQGVPDLTGVFAASVALGAPCGEREPRAIDTKEMSAFEKLWLAEPERLRRDVATCGLSDGFVSRCAN